MLRQVVGSAKRRRSRQRGGSRRRYTCVVVRQYHGCCVSCDASFLLLPKGPTVRVACGPGRNSTFMPEKEEGEKERNSFFSY